MAVVARDSGDSLREIVGPCFASAVSNIGLRNSPSTIASKSRAAFHSFAGSGAGEGRVARPAAIWPVDEARGGAGGAVPAMAGAGIALMSSHL